MIRICLGAGNSVIRVITLYPPTDEQSIISYNIINYNIIFYTCRYGNGDRQRESTLLWSACTTTTYSKSLSTSKAFRSKWLCDTFMKDKYLNLVIISMSVRFLKWLRRDDSIFVGSISTSHFYIIHNYTVAYFGCFFTILVTSQTHFWY